MSDNIKRISIRVDRLAISFDLNMTGILCGQLLNIVPGLASHNSVVMLFLLCSLKIIFFRILSHLHEVLLSTCLT